MVNSTFPLDFIITVNSKKEILLFHKDMQQTLPDLRGLSSREAPLVYLINFNGSVKALDFSKLPQLCS